MTLTRNGREERVFTIELRSKGNVKNVSMDGDERVFIEGSLGPLKRARFVEDLVLEVIGSNGALRLDLAPVDVHKHPGTDAPNDGRGGP